MAMNREVHEATQRTAPVEVPSRQEIEDLMREITVGQFTVRQNAAAVEAPAEAPVGMDVDAGGAETEGQNDEGQNDEGQNDEGQQHEEQGEGDQAGTEDTAITFLWMWEPV